MKLTKGLTIVSLALLTGSIGCEYYSDSKPGGLSPTQAEGKAVPPPAIQPEDTKTVEEIKKLEARIEELTKKSETATKEMEAKSAAEKAAAAADKAATAEQLAKLKKELEETKKKLEAAPITPSTPSTVDTTPPKVEWSIPSKGDKDFKVTYPIAVKFSELIKTDPVILMLKTDDGIFPIELKGAKTVNAGQYEFRAPLAPGKTYTATLEDVTDLAGNKMAPYSWSFTTTPATVTTKHVTDIALIGGSGWTSVPVAISKGDGTFTVTNEPIGEFAGWATTDGVEKLTGDFNGDGKTDIALTGPSGWNTMPVAYSNGDGTFDVKNQKTDFIAGKDYGSENFAIWAAQANASKLTGDFNGDGKTDIALAGPSGWNTVPVAFSNGDGTFNVKNRGVGSDPSGGAGTFPEWAAQANASKLTGDFNGDGKTDIVLTGPSGWNTVPVAFSNGDGTFDVKDIIGDNAVKNFAGWAADTNASKLTGDFDFKSP